MITALNSPPLVKTFCPPASVRHRWDARNGRFIDSTNPWVRCLPLALIIFGGGLGWFFVFAIIEAVKALVDLARQWWAS